MRTAAIIITFTILGSLVYAAGQGPVTRPQPLGAVTRPPVHAGGVARQRQQDMAARREDRAAQHLGNTMYAVAGGDGYCAIGEPLNWFTQVHVLPSCLNATLGYTYAGESGFDCNADGNLDWLAYVTNVSETECEQGDSDCVQVGATYFSMSGGWWYPDSPYPPNDDLFPFPNAAGLYRISLSQSDGVTTVTYHSVLSGAVLNAAICAVADCEAPGLNVGAYAKTLHDWDGDGDLDLFVYVYWSTSSQWGSGMVLIENTVKANPALAADINRDGVVDGKDLATVLSAWTP
jgi:hypothetical protein